MLPPILPCRCHPSPSRGGGGGGGGGCGHGLEATRRRHHVLVRSEYIPGDKPSVQSALITASAALTVILSLYYGTRREPALCDLCAGNGGIRCLICGGSGKLVGGVGVNKKNECRACIGTGLVPCSKCRGKGFV